MVEKLIDTLMDFNETPPRPHRRNVIFIFSCVENRKFNMLDAVYFHRGFESEFVFGNGSINSLPSFCLRRNSFSK